MRLTENVQRGTTMAISTLKFQLIRGVLRRGNGLVCTPDSRRAERLFGQGGAGRLGHFSTGCKMESLVGTGYIARGDTCVKSFVRRMAASGILSNPRETRKAKSSKLLLQALLKLLLRWLHLAGERLSAGICAIRRA